MGKTTGLEEVGIKAAVDGLIKIGQAEDYEIGMGWVKKDTVSIVRNTDEVVDKMDVIQMDIGVLEDGIYHQNMLGLEFKHHVMAKDQRRLGKSCIQSVDVYYLAYLLQVCVKDNKPTEGLVHWQGYNKKSGIVTIPWYYIEKVGDFGKGHRKRVRTNRFSPNLSNEE